MSRPIDFGTHFGVEDRAELIGRKWVKWDTARDIWKNQVEELRNYLFATDTRTTTNNKLPWKNSTTIPFLTTLRDRLHAHLMSVMFPNEEWMQWVARDRTALHKNLANNVTAFMRTKLDQGGFVSASEKLTLDLIDTGNCFAEPIFKRITKEDYQGSEFVVFEGSCARRISPYDIVFDPSVEDFKDTPVITRSVKSVGEILNDMENDPGLNYNADALKRLTENKAALRHYYKIEHRKVNGFRLDGFGSIDMYLDSDAVEILEFRGDWYDPTTGELQRNKLISVIDRCYILRDIDIPAWQQKNVFHAGWRRRPDNLWHMGPLDNLIGMQYRMDHIENATADAIDEYIHPKKKIKGVVEDFGDEPGERIYMGDDGEVIFERIDLGFMQYDNKMEAYMRLMEEFTGAPKDLAGIRTPGNKTLFEVSELKNNSQKIFFNRTERIEQDFVEPLINSMLDLNIRRMTSALQIPVLDEDLGITAFIEIEPKDISGNGSIRPIGTRRYRTREKLLQDLMNLANSPLGQDPAVKVHFSGKAIANMLESILGVERFQIIRPYIGVFEQAELQRLINSAQEEIDIEDQTPVEEETTEESFI